MDDVLSRRTVRHLLLRRRNERVAQLRDDRMPRRVSMNLRTLEELLTDSDPAEQWTLDFEGMEFMGIPVVVDPSLEVGVVAVDWPGAELAAGREADGG